MPQLCPQVFLVWLIHIPALPTEPGAGWADASNSPDLRDHTFHLLRGSGRQEWEFEGRKIGLGFIFPKEIAGAVYQDGAQEGLTLLGTCTVVPGGSEFPGEALLLRTPSPSITWINCAMEQLS